MTEVEQLSKKLETANAIIAALQRRNQLLADQYAFLVKYQQQVQTDQEVHRTQLLT